MTLDAGFIQKLDYTHASRPISLAELRHPEIYNLFLYTPYLPAEVLIAMKRDGITTTGSRDEHTPGAFWEMVMDFY